MSNLRATNANTMVASWIANARPWKILCHNMYISRLWRTHDTSSHSIPKSLECVRLVDGENEKMVRLELRNSQEVSQIRYLSSVQGGILQPSKKVKQENKGARREDEHLLPTQPGLYEVPKIELSTYLLS